MADSDFQIPEWTMTQGIDESIKEDPSFQVELFACIDRFNRGDWGVVSEEDARANDREYESYGRALAAYNTSHGRIWINAVDFFKTIMYPQEY